MDWSRVLEYLWLPWDLAVPFLASIAVIAFNECPLIRKFFDR